MSKEKWFLQFFLKNGDVYTFYSYSKRRTLKQSKLWYDFFDGQVFRVCSNFVLK